MNTGLFNMVCLFLFVFSNSYHGQNIRIKPTIAFAHINSSAPITILDKMTLAYGVSIASDWYEKENYSINTELGFHQRGGKEKNPLLPDEYKDFSKKWNHLYLLTTLRYKWSLTHSDIYVGAGPQIDYLLGNKNDFENTPYQGMYTLKKCSMSIVPEVGIKKYNDNIHYGIELSYPIGITNMASARYNRLYSNMLKIGIFLGYDFK